MRLKPILVVGAIREQTLKTDERVGKLEIHSTTVTETKDPSPAHSAVVTNELTCGHHFEENENDYHDPVGSAKSVEAAESESRVFRPSEHEAQGGLVSSRNFWVL